MLTLFLALNVLAADADKLGDPAAQAAVADKLGEPFPPASLPASFRLPPAVPSGPTYQVMLPLYPDAPTRADLEPIGARLEAVQVALKAMADARPLDAPKANPCVEGCDCRYPGDCKEAGCRCRSTVRAAAARPAAAPVAKQWFNLTNEPGTQGYGALNAHGQVVVERRRAKPVASPRPVAVPPVRPYLLTSPVFYSGGVCASGRCGR